MKYIITGSLGHISRPIVKQLTDANHETTVITSSPARKSEIEVLGAKAAIGSVTDRDFLRGTFKEADAVYLMVPPNFTVEDFPAYQRQVADAYIDAIQQGSIKYVVLLSSVGAHLRKGAGPIDGLGYLEERLQALTNIHVKALRPSYFYYNFYTMKDLIAHAGIMGGNLNNGKEKIGLVHHLDIAARVLDHLLHLNFTGFSVEYVASDERYAQDIARVLGQSIGKEIPWVDFSDEQALEGMLGSGLKRSMAENYVAMGKAFREGRVQEDYWKNRPGTLGKHKLEDFAKEFAEAFAG